jgi:hypothetical protein
VKKKLRQEVRNKLEMYLYKTVEMAAVVLLKKSNGKMFDLISNY